MHILIKPLSIGALIVIVGLVAVFFTHGTTDTAVYATTLQEVQPLTQAVEETTEVNTEELTEALSTLQSILSRLPTLQDLQNLSSALSAHREALQLLPASLTTSGNTISADALGRSIGSTADSLTKSTDKAVAERLSLQGGTLTGALTGTEAAFKELSATTGSFSGTLTLNSYQNQYLTERGTIAATAQRMRHSTGTTAERTSMGANLSGSVKWHGDVLGPDGKIYGIPFNSNDILIIDPASGTAERSNMGANLSGNSKWQGGV